MYIYIWVVLCQVLLGQQSIKGTPVQRESAGMKLMRARDRSEPEARRQRWGTFPASLSTTLLYIYIYIYIYITPACD